ncbi:hypothetical protein BC830DRAFT_629994 [Chytriomyces sp. MP71]|nr:hypothetical protein BC830DRAFT_629994 [Chytriomyces sp. MP71]
MGPGGPSQGVLPRPVILSRDGMVTDAVQQQSLPPISSGTHAPASSFRSQSPSPSPQPGNIVPIPPRTSSLRPTSPLPRPAQPMVNPAPLTTSHSEPTLTLSTTPIQIPSVQTQPPSPVTSGSSPSTSYNSTANPDGATVPNGRVRKPPPAPKSNAPKSLNLESKFQLAKLCIEGSVLYGASDVEIQALKDEGYAHLTDLSSQGMADANYYLGKCFAEDGNYAMAFPAFLRAAKAQLPEASFAAASCLEVGKGTPVSYLTARYYYTASAEAGYLLAMHRMAAGLLNGEIGFERDVYGGIKWLEKCAAYQRYFDAALDPVKSLSLYQLSQLYEYGIPGVMQPSIILALKFLQEAAAESYPAALTRLAAAYESGSMNLPCDIEKASKLYTKAAELQDLEALFVMADLSLRGLTIIDCDCALADLEIPASLTQYLLPDPPEESLCETWDLPGFSSPPTETPTSSPQQPVPNLFPPKHSGPCSYKTLIPQDALLAFQYLNQITSHPSCPGKLHADAQYALGYLYEHPLLEPTVHQDSMKAIALYEAAALGGSLLARHRVAQMRAASALNEGMLMEDAGLESVNSRSGVGGIFGKAGEEDAARDAFRKAMEGAGGTFGVAGGEDRRFGIVKARRVRKKATEEFEKKLEVAGMLSAPVLDLKAMSDAKERRSTAWQSGGQPQGDEKCLLM